MMNILCQWKVLLENKICLNDKTREVKDRKIKNHWKVRKGLWVFKILNINFIKSKSLIEAWLCCNCGTVPQLQPAIESTVTLLHLSGSNGWLQRLSL